jgi:magnesium transporter
MNVPYPGTGETWGVVASSTIALTCSGGLYALFKRKGWL